MPARTPTDTVHHPGAWVLITLSDSERQHAGNEGYDDDLTRRYVWDSTVPNHSRLRRHDVVLLRNRSTPLGVARIQTIETDPRASKLRFRCPSCDTTNLKSRDTVAPRFRCGRCKHEFEEPLSETLDVTRYVAHLMQFTPFRRVPPLHRVRMCLVREKSQHAMSEAHAARLFELLEETDTHFPRAGGAPVEPGM